MYFYWIELIIIMLKKERFLQSSMIRQGVLLKDINRATFSVEPGLAKAISDSERLSDFYKWATTESRDYHIALEERIRLPFENGMLVVRKGDGSIKFDDRKLRFSGYHQRDGRTVLQIGPTHFGEIKATDIKSTIDERFEESLVVRGVNDFNDRFAYLASSVAVNSVPVTKEGYVHVFKRGSKQELLPGKWDVYGGFVEVGEDIFTLHEEDMTDKFFGLLDRNVRKEFVEETGNNQDAFELMGLVKGVNFVFSYKANLAVSSEEFIAKHASAKDASEVGNIRVLKTPADMDKFLKTERSNSSPTAYQTLQLYYDKLVA